MDKVRIWWDKILYICGLKITEIFKDASLDIYNKRFFTTTVIRYIKRANCYGINCCLCFLDVDGLKTINDDPELGHLAGDHVLQHVAKTLVDNGTKNHIPCRFGGDEFVVFIYNSNKNQARKYCLAVQKQLKESRIPEFPKLKGISMSYGIKDTLNKTDYKKILSSADQEMYKNKKFGKSAIIESYGSNILESSNDLEKAIVDN